MKMRTYYWDSEQKRYVTDYTYSSYRNMRQRALYSPKYQKLKHNPKWLERGTGYQIFVSDMGVRPEGCTLDRVDNSKGYYKGNCRWVTPHIQKLNQVATNGFRKSFKHRLKISRIKMGLNKTQLAKELNLAYRQIHDWERGEYVANIMSCEILSKTLKIKLKSLWRPYSS